MAVTNYHARQEMMLSSDTSKLIKNIRILVIGVGAGGNEVLKNLLLMGFGNFTIIDFDTVEDSNLSRTTLFRKEDIGKSKSIVAAKRLSEMALHEHPHIVGLHGNFMTDFGKGLFIEHDIVISCVDTQKCRAFINDWCVRTRTPFFEMGFERFNVNVSFFAPTGPMRQKDGRIIDTLPTSDGFFPEFLEDFPVCLREEIGFGSFEEKRNSCSGLKAKDTNLTKIPTIQVAASMAGTLISTEIIKFLSGKDTIRNKVLFFSGISYETLPVGYRRSPKCWIHDEHIPIEIVPTTPNTSLRNVIDEIESQFGAQALLTLPDVFIISGKCHICGNELTINKRFADVYDDERWCENCKDKYPKDYHLRIEKPNSFVKIPREISRSTEQKFLDMHLNEIGIPDNDILSCMLIEGVNCKNIMVYLKV